MISLCICAEHNEALSPLGLKTLSVFNRRATPAILYNLLNDKGFTADYDTIDSCDAIVLGVGWEKNYRARLCYAHAIKQGLVIIYEIDMDKSFGEIDPDNYSQINVFSKIKALNKKNEPN